MEVDFSNIRRLNSISLPACNSQLSVDCSQIILYFSITSSFISDFPFIPFSSVFSFALLFLYNRFASFQRMAIATPTNCYGERSLHETGIAFNHILFYFMLVSSVQCIVSFAFHIVALFVFYSFKAKYESENVALVATSSCAFQNNSTSKSTTTSFTLL